MKTALIAFVSFFLFAGAVSAETALSGKIGGMTLDSTGSPYKVTADLLVQKGKTLTLKPGCALLIKPCGRQCRSCWGQVQVNTV